MGEPDDRSRNEPAVTGANRAGQGRAPIVGCAWLSCPGEPVTFVFTDRAPLACSTSSAPTTKRCWRHIGRSFERRSQSHGGIEVDTQGDAFFYACAQDDFAERLNGPEIGATPVANRVLEERNRKAGTDVG